MAGDVPGCGGSSATGARKPAPDSGPGRRAERNDGVEQEVPSPVARYRESVCRLCRREAMKLFLKGDRCFTNKCAIERRNFPPGPARQASVEDPRLRHPAPREAEGQEVLRPPRGAVPADLREGRADARRHGREPPLPPRAPARQRRPPARLRRVAPAGPPARPARPRHRQRPEGRRPELRRRGRARSSRSRRRAARTRASWPPSTRPRGAAFPTWLELSAVRVPGERVKALPQREDVSLPVNEKLIVELYSK